MSSEFPTVSAGYIPPLVGDLSAPIPEAIFQGLSGAASDAEKLMNILETSQSAGNPVINTTSISFSTPSDILSPELSKHVDPNPSEEIL
jgi:hypothetical protein